MKKSNRELAAEIRAARANGYKSPVPREHASEQPQEYAEERIPVDEMLRGDGRWLRDSDVFDTVATATLGRRHG